jgi:GH25 family lysozyme M1 (1,4-beta-N-acetylmuramidase)
MRMIRNFVVDMYHLDEVTSFAEAGQAGIIGIIHKASTGAGGKDPRYAERKAAAYQAGLLWGAYHWGTAADIDAQVDNFLSVINPAGPVGGLAGVLVALDFERTYLDGSSEDTMSLDQARQFVSKLDQILGRNVVIYGGDLIKSGLGDTVDPFWGAHRLWLAEYREPPPRWQTSWQGPWLWQYTGNGTCPGIPGDSQGRVDCNTFLGDVSAQVSQWAS